MNINERLEAAKARLAEVKDGEDADALQSAIDEFKAAEAAKKSADEADELIKSLGTIKENQMPETTAPRTLGEFAEKNLDLTALRAGRAQSAGTDFGFKAYTDAQVTQTIVDYNRNVADFAIRNLAVRELFGAEQISGNALTYFTLGAKEDNSAPSPKSVNENAAKPQFHIVEGTVTANLAKIAGWFYETDELLEDAPFLASALNNRGLYELDSAVESYLLTTLQSVSGIGTDTYTYGQDVDPDTIFDAIMTIRKDSPFNADAIIIHPTDYAALRELKTASGSKEYVGGGFFFGPYGQGDVALYPGIWGLRTVVTPNIAQGTVLVGAFKQGASVVTKAGAGARIEIVKGDHDDAIYNRVTVVVEERLALATRYPKAFVKITEAASS